MLLIRLTSAAHDYLTPSDVLIMLHFQLLYPYDVNSCPFINFVQNALLGHLLI